VSAVLNAGDGYGAHLVVDAVGVQDPRSKPRHGTPQWSNHQNRLGLSAGRFILTASLPKPPRSKGRLVTYMAPGSASSH
jgi:hypothetical protein